MVVLHDFTPCVDDELEVKRGQVRVVLKCKIANTHTLCFPAFSPRFSSEKLQFYRPPVTNELIFPLSVYFSREKTGKKEIYRRKKRGKRSEVQPT